MDLADRVAALEKQLALLAEQVRKLSGKHTVEITDAAEEEK